VRIDAFGLPVENILGRAANPGQPGWRGIPDVSSSQARADSGSEFLLLEKASNTRSPNDLASRHLPTENTKHFLDSLLTLFEDRIVLIRAGWSRYRLCG
jgi:hypothetical protein